MNERSESMTADLDKAIRAGCDEADIHLHCTYPECGCKQTPKITTGVIRSLADNPSEEAIEAMVRGACSDLGYEPGARWRNITTAADLDDVMRAGLAAYFKRILGEK